MNRKRREKMFDAGDIRLLMLHFISQGIAHGYELIKSIEELSKGEYTPSPGIIYPNLSLLGERDFIQAKETKSGRKAYRLTPEGELELRQNQQAVQRVIGRLSSLAVLANNRSIPEVQRAIHNLKMALHTRLSEPALSQQTLYQIIDALDEAARRIERS